MRVCMSKPMNSCVAKCMNWPPSTASPPSSPPPWTWIVCYKSSPPRPSEMHSVLCVPLEVKRNVLGCICIYSSHRYLLSEEQMQLVITFANEAAIALDNARLYEEARHGLEIKTILLRELHHRVKNNLATVAGILSLQMRRTRSPEARHILAESVNRVQ